MAALQSSLWVRCQDGVRRSPSDVLLAAHPDYEDAAIADIDPGLADRLVQEGIQFGTRVPKSAAIRRLAMRGNGPIEDRELASILDEATGDVSNGRATMAELTTALRAVRLHGHVLDRVVRRTGVGFGARADLSGWVASLADLEPDLRAALEALPLSFPETTTGRHALEFLRQVWSGKPLGAIEELRRHLAAAYRYVLDDAATDLELAAMWHAALSEVHLFGGRVWHPLSQRLVVADVQSPSIRRRLSGDRIVVASTHLGDSDEQVRRVARALGLGCLSEEVRVIRGEILAEPSWSSSLERLFVMLASLDDRRAIRVVQFVDSLELHTTQSTFRIHAYVEDGTLLLAGSPAMFAAEATSQLVEHFQLSQRGNDVPFLTMALARIGNADELEESLEVLAAGLDLPITGSPVRSAPTLIPAFPLSPIVAPPDSSYPKPEEMPGPDPASAMGTGDTGGSVAIPRACFGRQAGAATTRSLPGDRRVRCVRPASDRGGNGAYDARR